MNPRLEVYSDADKCTVRQALRTLPDGEILWQRVQAGVYGPGIFKALPCSGVKQFLIACLNAGHELFVVSHKTRFAIQDTGQRHDLHQAAKNWLERYGLFDPRYSPLRLEHCFFLPTRRDKCLRIAELRCDWFVDDLPEVFTDDAFPISTQTILFCGGGCSLEDPVEEHAGRMASSWEVVEATILS